MWRNLTLTQLLPGPSQETDRPGKHSSPGTQRSQEAQWQVGDPKLGTQSNGAPAPAPPRAAQYSPEPQGPGVTATLSQEQLPGSPHTAQGHSGAAPDLPREGSRGGETKGRKREGSSALWSTKGGKKG